MMNLPISPPTVMMLDKPLINKSTPVPVVTVETPASDKKQETALIPVQPTIQQWQANSLTPLNPSPFPLPKGEGGISDSFWFDAETKKEGPVLPSPLGRGKGEGLINNYAAFEKAISTTKSTDRVGTTAPTKPALDLKSMLQKGEAAIYALNIRTFGAHDDDGDGIISPEKGEGGTFLSAIRRLPELKADGFNTIHVLPVTAIGQSPRLGQAGSLYAPASYTQLNPQFDVPGNGVSAMQEFRAFVEAAHEQGLAVMVDLPSCASHDLAQSRPDLIARDDSGTPLTPTNWVDVVMMKRDTPQMRDYFNQFCDEMANQAGVDGFRCDIARARTPEFWQDLTSRYPNHGWLAESYIEEDDSPLKNLPRDYPTKLLQSGFDTFYGQFHIFYNMSGQEYTDYVSSTWNHLKDLNQPKAFTGTFYTHDDHSMMEHGGVPEIRLALAMEALQPFSNEYVMDGMLTGDPKTYDIFDYKPPAKGDHPELTDFFKVMNGFRQTHPGEVLQGSYTPLPVEMDAAEKQVIAFARNSADGKSLIVLANKDINDQSEATITLPGVKPDQPLPPDLVPHEQFPGTGEGSKLTVSDPDRLTVTLTPGAIHVFELDGKRIAAELPTLSPWIPPEKRPVGSTDNGELAAEDAETSVAPKVDAPTNTVASQETSSPINPATVSTNPRPIAKSLNLTA